MLFSLLDYIGPRRSPSIEYVADRPGLIGFYREIAGVRLVFPRADRPTAVEWAGGLIMLRRIVAIEYVEEMRSG